MAIVHSLLNYASEILSLSPGERGGGGGGSPIKVTGMLVRTFKLNPRETNVGVAEA